MTLLICTQTVDKEDPVLGFFHRWIEEFAEKYERILVVCLREGTHSLPPNVKVFSLGAGNKLVRASRFYTLLRSLTYDVVFVHMSQEFVVLGGPLWKLQKKPVYLWRNHYKGSLITDFAALFCKYVFCTSKYSYTAKYKKTRFMPVGVDTKTFAPQPDVVRRSHSILFFGRMTPSKKPELLLEALGAVHKSGKEFTATLAGPGETSYREELAALANKLGVAERVRFTDGVSHKEAARLCNEHEIYVNCSPPGMYDKTILEAPAAGCLLLASNKDMVGQVPDECVFVDGDTEDLARKLGVLLEAPPAEAERIRAGLRTFVARNDLKTLVSKLSAVIQ